MRDRAAQLRVDLAVDRPGARQAVEEPGGGAVGEALELGDLEVVAADSSASTRGCGAACAASKARERALEPALPAVRARERLGAPAPSEASSASARSRSRSLGAASSGHVSAESGRRRVQRRDLLGREERSDLVPERARLARAALVGGGLADEVSRRVARVHAV